MGMALSVRKSAFPISILLEIRVFLHSAKTWHVPEAAVFRTVVCWKHLQVSEPPARCVQALFQQGFSGC